MWSCSSCSCSLKYHSRQKGTFGSSNCWLQWRLITCTWYVGVKEYFQKTLSIFRSLVAQSLFWYRVLIFQVARRYFCSVKRLTKTMSRFILLCIQKVSTVIWKFTCAYQFIVHIYYLMFIWKYVFISSNYIKGGEPVTCKGEFTASGVHKQFGISFKTPKYPNQSIREDVRVRRVSKKLKAPLFQIRRVLLH